MGEVFKLFGTIGINNKEANKSLDETESKGKSTANKLGGFFSNLASKMRGIQIFRPMSEEATAFAMKSLVSIATVGVAITGFAIKAAGDMQAMNAQFSQVFGEFETKAEKSINSISKKTNILPNRLKPAFTSMAAFAKTAGMDTADALSLSERATIAAADSAAFYDRSIGEVTESLQSYLKGNYENDAALGISSTETTRNAAANKLYGKSFNDLSESQKQLTLLQMVEDGNKLSGALGQAAREGSGMENVLGNLKQAAVDLSAAFGAPMLQPFLAIIEGITNAMSHLATVFRENQALVYVVVGAITTLAAALGAMIIASKAAGWMTALKKALIGVKAAEGVAAQVGLLTNPIGWVVVAIGALITAFVYFYNTSETFRNGVNKLVSVIKEGLVKAFDLLLKGLAAIMPTLKQVGSIIADVVVKSFDKVVEVSSRILAVVIPVLQKFAEAVKGLVSSGLEKLGVVFRQIGEVLSSAFLSTISAVSAAFSVMRQAIADLLASGLEKFGTTMSSIAQTVSGIFSDSLRIAGDLLEKLGGSFGKIGGVISIAISLLTKIGLVALGITGPWGILIGIIISFLTMWAKTGDLNADGITKVFDQINETIANVADMIAKYLPVIIETITNILVMIIEKMTEYIPLIVETITNIITMLVETITTYLPMFIELAVQLITKLVEGLTTALPLLTEAFLNIITNVVQLITTLLPQIIQMGMQLLTALINGITTALPIILDVGIQIITFLIEAMANALPQLVEVAIQIITTLLNALIAALPILIDVGINVLTTLLDALIGALPLLIDAGIQIITTLLNALIGALPTLIDAGIKVTTTLLDAIIAALPKLIDAGIQILMALISGVISILPALVQAAIQIVMALINALIASLPQIIAAGIQLLMALINGIISILPALINAALQITMALVNALIASLPQIIAAGVQLLMALINGIISILPALINAALQIIVALANTLIAALPQIISAGIQIVMALISGIVQLLPQLLNIFVVAWNGIKSAVSLIVQALVSAVVSFFTGLWNRITSIFNGIRNAASTVWNGIKSVVSSVVSGIVSVAVNLFNGLRNTISNIWNGIHSVISGIVNGVKNTISNVWSGLTGIVSGVFDGVKNAIQGPMNSARDFIKGIIDTIKGFFSFSISWPKIPLPHFSISPAGWSVGDLLKGKIPSLGIDWYAKGGILTQPTAFGMNGNNLMVGGEAGAEAVAPIDTLMGYVETAVRGVIGEQKDGDIYVTQNISSPEPLTPREIARETKLRLQDLAALKK
ncbi:hypothetical protein [Enterococcus faecium]|uniref:hypothetical protein n=1 Tax=Enterococcus faecium TaxID=1352 RepID=UPI0007DADC3A|nr:hypothetical protein [Enterococcus faecium]MCF8623028.1 hypothetical protein [Enterococcus faecium]OAQ39467.1 hypothetical protein A5489_04565 [Enterococcus faecium]RBS98650.1 hypothetical protein EB64_01204 [Enterococcus faecium]